MTETVELVSIRSGVPGRVLEILVRKDEVVVQGSVVAVVESMKMEVEVESPCEGTIQEVVGAVDQLVEDTTVLAIVKRS